MSLWKQGIQTFALACMALSCGLQTLSADSGAGDLYPWQHNYGGVCTTNVFRQFYPDQNACRLYHSIPEDLRHLPYAIYPISKGYDTARFNFNKRFNIFPHAIFTPRTEDELVSVFKKLKKHHLEFSIRSGGHCLEPGSLSSGYVIDLRNFNKIIPDIECEQVYIGAGCRLGTVIETLGNIDYAIPTGTCSSVGVGGLSLGGGLGLLGRTFGLTCDSIKSIRLLGADGGIIDVNSKQHPELFWALRGAGNGSYGIVIGFTFTMHYIPQVSYYTLSWKWEKETVKKVFQAWQDWIETLPDNITSQLQLKYMNQELSVGIVGLKVSDKPFCEWKKAFAHLHPKVTVTEESYLDSARQWSDRATYAFLKSKSEMIMKPLSSKPIQKAINFFEKLHKQKESYYAFFELEAMGGKIKKGNTAFYPRKAQSWWYQVIYWNDETQQKRALHLLRKFHADLSPYVSPYAYANIVDYDLGHKYLKAYYGTHVSRLKKVKHKYDPENFFHWRQSIPD